MDGFLVCNVKYVGKSTIFNEHHSKNHRHLPKLWLWSTCRSLHQSRVTRSQGNDVVSGDRASVMAWHFRNAAVLDDLPCTERTA